ncbi:uncharacterized protein HaLaN_09581 [Haematococcus lacustris]|uniref:Uncharacterized protein n=1 Tax=Haematococcus lacustris TaxID=44745 RepID=A0A699ZDS4_HAELA|nr:uncharacterized protein HaLaN_09581 [Haematococcus lacustris]
MGGRDEFAAGAVLYGDNPSLIHARRSRMAYGVRSCCPYVPGAPGKFFHLEDKCWYTNSLFVPYVERNEMVARDHEVVHELQPLYRSSDEVQLQLYATDESNTTWVDDDKMGQSVQQLCKLRTALPSYATNADRTIHLRQDQQRRHCPLHLLAPCYSKFRFGQTEITATAWNNATGDRMETSITFAQA